MDTVIPESTISKLSDLAEVERNAIFSKVAPNPATFPLWCNHREKQNSISAAYTDKLRNFDIVTEDAEKIS